MSEVLRDFPEVSWLCCLCKLRIKEIATRYPNFAVLITIKITRVVIVFSWQFHVKSA